jgi:beta-galactosidase/beta-glucuronidase
MLVLYSPRFNVSPEEMLSPDVHAAARIGRIVFRSLLREARMKVLLLFLSAVLTVSAQQYTRGVGVYPGRASQYNGAVMKPDTVTYRNLALHRPAYSSSSYDYSLTAQLVTDGIRDTRMPRWITASSSVDGLLPRNRREHLTDENPVSTIPLPGSGGWVQISMEGGDGPAEVDRIEVSARPATLYEQPQAWSVAVLGSNDGQNWDAVGRATATEVLSSADPSDPKEIKASFVLAKVSTNRFYRVSVDAPQVAKWGVGEVRLFRNNQHLNVGGPYSFTSAWMSSGQSEEWVYVDLGAECSFDHVVLFWINRPAEGAIQVSNDARNWATMQALAPGSAKTDDFKLADPKHGRYVRVLMARPATSSAYILSELEVFGRGGLVPTLPRAAVPHSGTREDLARGEWRLQRDSLVTADGAAISKPGFSAKEWLPATVPGTVLSSYVDDGVIADPNYGRNQLLISDSYFWANFWYRDEFLVPALTPGRRLWLNFDGVNWKADVFFNGVMVGKIEGGFLRARFDVTKFVHGGTKNAVAVLIHKNDNPGAVKEKTLAETDVNGGALGADNPTYHASIGWDWIPSMRGRNIGIWGDVYLTASGPVTIDSPFVSTVLPVRDLSRAEISIETMLQNHTQRAVIGTLRGRFGDIPFQKRVTVRAASTLAVKIDPSSFPALSIKNPRLWWPNGYGDPNLYDVKLSFETGAQGISDSKSFRTGVRQFTYKDDGEVLKIFINGRRLIPRGGNWGFAESMLRYRSREYDAAVRYHREMNFNMIRNWVGQIGDEAFYEACDKYGIVVWQDFWLANPFDGPDPNDNDVFLRNATDLVERIRNHPSIGVYCGRNEGNPPQPLDDGLKEILARLHPGMRYFSSSSFGVVSGGGPYEAKPVKYYFEERATPKLHSEVGMPNIVTLDSLKQMMPEQDLWPQSDDWGMHDFTLTGAQHIEAYRSLLEGSYGTADNAADWLELAQFENYDGYRAMFEAQSKNRMGVLLWMSHPAWPSFVWQTYDYYFEPTAAYFGSKKGCEPLHIQWNRATDEVEVVNYSAGMVKGLTATAEILNMDGSVRATQRADLDSEEDTVTKTYTLSFPSDVSATHFIRLKLARGPEVLSENFYLRGVEGTNYQAIRELPKVKLSAATQVTSHGQQWVLTTVLKNASSTPALMVHVKAVRSQSGDRILPAIYNDNYIPLMPGEERTIHTELDNADTRGERPSIAVDGFNVSGVEQ